MKIGFNLLERHVLPRKSSSLQVLRGSLMEKMQKDSHYIMLIFMTHFFPAPAPPHL